MKNKKIDIVVDKYGHNTFPVLIDTLQNKPKEIIILLINKYENQKNICINKWKYIYN